MLINNDTYQRETLSERPIRQPLLRSILQLGIRSYTPGYVIMYIIKTTEPNHLILILNLANKSYFIIIVNFCHLLAWFKNYDPLKIGVNSFWDTLYVGSCKLEYVDQTKILGLWLHNDLKWQTQVDVTFKKANKRLFMLRSLRRFGFDQDKLTVVYKSYVRPVIECSCGLALRAYLQTGWWFRAYSKNGM